MPTLTVARMSGHNSQVRIAPLFLRSYSLAFSGVPSANPEEANPQASDAEPL